MLNIEDLKRGKVRDEETYNTLKDEKTQEVLVDDKLKKSSQGKAPKKLETSPFDHSLR